MPGGIFATRPRGEARGLAVEILGRGEHAPSGGRLFTPRAKKVLELASGQAAGGHVGSEHIRLGLILEGNGAGALMLPVLGADQNWVRLRVTQLQRAAKTGT